MGVSSNHQSSAQEFLWNFFRTGGQSRTRTYDVAMTLDLQSSAIAALPSTHTNLELFSFWFSSSSMHTSSRDGCAEARETCCFFLAFEFSMFTVRQWFHHWVRRRESHPNFQGHNLASCLLDDDRHAIFGTAIKVLNKNLGLALRPDPKEKSLCQTAYSSVFQLKSDRLKFSFESKTLESLTKALAR
jgi:hypothetical protein